MSVLIKGLKMPKNGTCIDIEIVISDDGTVNYYDYDDLDYKKLGEAVNLPDHGDLIMVVRCKDCKHSVAWYSDRRRCFLWNRVGSAVWDDGYCSYGERSID